MDLRSKHTYITSVKVHVRVCVCVSECVSFLFGGLRALIRQPVPPPTRHRLRLDGKKREKWSTPAAAAVLVTAKREREMCAPASFLRCTSDAMQCTAAVEAEGEIPVPVHATAAAAAAVGMRHGFFLLFWWNTLHDPHDPQVKMPMLVRAATGSSAAQTHLFLLSSLILCSKRWVVFVPN